jgi:hypothetical protein
MGLTIHYRLGLSQGTLRDVRRMVRRWHAAAGECNFAAVGPIEEFPGTPERELDVTFRLGRAGGRDVPPRRAIGFTVLPGPGCESAELGLAILPATVRRGRKTVRTRNPGWRWYDFCKTQFASAPQLGGVENFLRCHLGLIRLLDEARALGIRVRVQDEGGYWKRRDQAALVRELQSYNEFLAGFGGELKDACGSAVTGPIFRFANFEHLEANARLRK